MVPVSGDHRRREQWRTLWRLLVYLTVAFPLTVALVWFTWSNVDFVLHTTSCERQGALCAEHR